ncbi:predicted protein [Aspergillus nidulans FGSC A4]|uniref:Uncharacterized protein n=1 Tax=Emericella nidulans (strain FGSC A4 / ATCC 38163 / CBS 112.46 / NRRL 194 / M139) TaxID=227321 RepID=Q5ASJ0_EMENI|nr:hypothetical protein [Aspergillus nidulans FGSC A4]EAA60533.1 predicted protein [Aspergillus nidulans FGSC A4]CBF78125.1 TPA: hypothetical protein ANIA_08740 [Aspergillus nidulans FGSC A4]|eukprot:XP_682009.1 predicted protein [Aspergillus nidulans FGSC A4]
MSLREPDLVSPACRSFVCFDSLRCLEMGFAEILGLNLVHLQPSEWSPAFLGGSRSSVLSPSPGDRMKALLGRGQTRGCARIGSASVLIANQASEVGWQLQLGLGPGLANTPGRESGNDFHPLRPSLGCRSLEKEASAAREPEIIVEWDR